MMADMDMDARLRFLAECGYLNAEIVKVAQDAGPRVYYSIEGAARPVLFVDAGTGSDGTDDFIRIGEWLRSIGLAAPEVYECDPTKRFLLVEDFGRTRLTDVLGASVGKDALAIAVEVLSALEDCPPPAAIPTWGLSEMIEESVFEFFGWWWPAAYGDTLPKEEAAADLRRALGEMVADLPPVTPCFVHKDYFSNNLMWLPERDGRQRVGILDFQNGSLGIPGHDLLSLLEDVRNPIPADLQGRLLEQYVQARPGQMQEDLIARYEAASVLRHIRVAGVWARICSRGRAATFSRFGAPTWAYLATALERPSAKPVRRWFDQWIPATRREHPPSVQA
jgi:aminoglycoside/choline kinase family phosphotransferase